MWRLLSTVALALTLPWQPAPVPVTFAWDLDPSHDGAVTWEVETAAGLVSCGSVLVLATERRCTASLPTGAQTVRLRGRVGDVPGGWSSAVTFTAGPGTAAGPFTIRSHFPQLPPHHGIKRGGG